MSQGHGHHLEGALAGHIWNILSIQLSMVMNYDFFFKMKFMSFYQQYGDYYYKCNKYMGDKGEPFHYRGFKDWLVNMECWSWKIILQSSW